MRNFHVLIKNQHLIKKKKKTTTTTTETKGRSLSMICGHKTESFQQFKSQEKGENFSFFLKGCLAQMSSYSSFFSVEGDAINKSAIKSPTLNRKLLKSSAVRRFYDQNALPNTARDNNRPQSGHEIKGSRHQERPRIPKRQSHERKEKRDGVSYFPPAQGRTEQAP